MINQANHLRLRDFLPDLGMQVSLDGAKPQAIGYLKCARPKDVDRSGKRWIMVTGDGGRFDFKVERMQLRMTKSKQDERSIHDIMRELDRNNVPDYAEINTLPQQEVIQFDWKVLLVTLDACEPLFDVEAFEPIAINGPDTAFPIWEFHSRADVGSMSIRPRPPFRRSHRPATP